MLRNLFRKQENLGVAFCDGVIIPLESVNDPVFSQKMMGDGIAIKPYDGEIVAPFDAQVVFVAPTSHAVGLKLKNRASILIHLGLDTVQLKGKGITVYCQEQEWVKKGQCLAKIDDNILKSKDLDMTCLMILTTTKYRLKILREGKVNKGKTEVCEITE